MMQITLPLCTQIQPWYAIYASILRHATPHPPTHHSPSTLPPRCPRPLVQSEALYPLQPETTSFPTHTRTHTHTDEELLTALRKGAFLLKHGRQGRPIVHFFRLDPFSNGGDLCWRSSSGSIRSVPLSSVLDITPGQSTEAFRRHPVAKTHECSLSLRYHDVTGANRTLDLTCRDSEQFSIWFQALLFVVDELHKTKGIASIISSPPHHPPGDVYVWGNVMSTNTTTSTSTTVPTKVPSNALLDVATASVGRKHASLVSTQGSVYAMGEGKGGKLGVGHDINAPNPLRVPFFLLPHHRHHNDDTNITNTTTTTMIATSCGDEYTAAISADGHLYAWGRVPGGGTDGTATSTTSATTAGGGHATPRGINTSIPIPIPIPILRSTGSTISTITTTSSVCQVSCGAYHAAAVTNDGRLFTWGEGFGGKLGHGDQHSRGHPTHVVALQSTPVVQVSCGVWHTAAVVLEPPGMFIGGGAGSGTPTGTPTSTPTRAHHRRTSSSFAFLSPSSSTSASMQQQQQMLGGEGGAYQEGRGGTLYTWGGVNECVQFSTTGTGTATATTTVATNRGCLGHGEEDVVGGCTLPTRVCIGTGTGTGSGVNTTITTGSNVLIRSVATGLHLTVALSTAGVVYQMGSTGAAVSSTAAGAAPWEGSSVPVAVGGGCWVITLWMRWHVGVSTWWYWLVYWIKRKDKDRWQQRQMCRRWCWRGGGGRRGSWGTGGERMRWCRWSWVGWRGRWRWLRGGAPPWWCVNTTSTNLRG